MREKETGKVESHRDLDVWRAGMDLTVTIYRLTGKLPPDERYGLVSQMRRAATSIPANIAEGHGRKTTGEFLQALSVSRGSLAELSTYLELSVRLEYVDRSDIEDAWALSVTSGKLLNGLMRSLESRKRHMSTARNEAGR